MLRLLVADRDRGLEEVHANLLAEAKRAKQLKVGQPDPRLVCALGRA